MPPSSTSPTRLIALEKQRKAMGLRQAGISYPAIARECGYSSPQAASRAVKSLMDRNVMESTADFRRTQFERLNYMISKLWPRVQDGDEKAILSVSQLMTQQDRLMGTEAPVEHTVRHEGAVLVIEGGESEYVDALEQMAVRAGAAPLGTIVIEDDDTVEAVLVEQPAIEAEAVSPPCPRYVRPADDARLASGMCARCPWPKEAH